PIMPETLLVPAKSISTTCGPRNGPVLDSLPAGRFGILGRSATMQSLFELLDRVLPSAVPVLIEGETGTGKELVARALHQFGPRRSGPWIAYNCGATPEPLLESELFGHAKGAFTGAWAE